MAWLKNNLQLHPNDLQHNFISSILNIMTEPRNYDEKSKPNVEAWFKKNQDSRHHSEITRAFLINHYTGNFHGFVNKTGRPEYRFNSHGTGYVSIITSINHSTVRFVLPRENVRKKFFIFSKTLKNKHGEDYNVFDLKISDKTQLADLEIFLSENWKLIPNFEMGNEFQKIKNDFDMEVENLLKTKITKPSGSKKPTKKISTITIYNRNAKVKAWVLQNSNGKCESCNSNTHFQAEHGISFLEVHHLKQLSDGGSDTVNNSVALCPNCHREIHLGLNKEKKKKNLYRTVKRLTLE